MSRTNLSKLGKLPPHTGAVALSLSLEDEASEAFVRLSKGLPGFADELREIADEVGLLGEDLVGVPAIEAEGSLEINKAIADLNLLVDHVEDEATKKRITKVSKSIESVLVVPQGKADLSTGDLESEGGALQPAQGNLFRVVAIEESRFAVVDLTGNRVSTHDTKEDAQDAADRRNGLKATIKIVEKKADEDEEERTVLGIALEPETIDAQNDIYSEEEIKKTAFRFMERYQQFGLMHKTIIPSILPLESYLAPVDFEIGGQTVKKGSWLVRVRVLDDEIWADVKSGKLTGFSIGGSAIRTPELSLAES